MKKKKNEISNISNKLYEEFLIKNEMLHRIITDNNLFKLDNPLLYVLHSFSFHTYFFRIILLTKYSEQDIQTMFIECLDKVVTPIANSINEKNEIVDMINEIFNILDALMFQVKNAENKEQSILAMQEIASFFIESVQDSEKNYTSNNSVAIMQIFIYFTSLLEDTELINKLEV